MSVVNDVLKNLNQRHAQASASLAIPYVYEQEKSPPYFMMVILAGLIMISLGLSVKLWLDSQNKYLALELDPELFFISQTPTDTEAELANQVPAMMPTIADQSASLAQQQRPVLTQAPAPQTMTVNVAKPLTNKPINNSVEPISKQSPQSLANSAAVNSMNNGDEIAATHSSQYADKAISDAIALRLMVKKNPQQVYGFIKDNYQNFDKQPDLLAIAAQAQQRIGEHLNAIELYQMLIRLQPQDARWRVGFAISLEGRNDRKSALKMYQMAMELGNLPQALFSFCQQRIQFLS